MISTNIMFKLLNFGEHILFEQKWKICKNICMSGAEHSYSHQTRKKYQCSGHHAAHT